MKKRVALVIAGWLAILVLTLPAFSASSFPDVDVDAPYADAVEYLNEIGIMQGDEKGNFNPNKSVSRAEMATIICRMMQETDDLSVSNEFLDVPSDYWANGYIAKVSQLGIVNGYGNGNFGPTDSVMYEQAITMIIRAVGGDTEAADAGGYPDGYIQVADENGLLQGVHAAKSTPMSRADIAIVLYNCIG